MRALIYCFVVVCLPAYSSSTWEIDAERANNIHDHALLLLNRMSLKEKLAQRLMLDLRYWLDEDGESYHCVTEMNNDIGYIIRDFGIGGVILFSQNITSIEQVSHFTDALQGARHPDQPLELFIGIDQEGGNVARLPGSESVNLPGNMALCAASYCHDTKNLGYEAGRLLGQQVLQAGFTVNFAPVVDVQDNPLNPVINVRAFSESQDRVSKLGIDVTKGIQDTGVIATYKHFPGHGNTTTDSHIDLPGVHRTLDEAQAVDLYPYRQAIASNQAPAMIMTAHIQYPALDDAVIQCTKAPFNTITVPATFSRKIQHDILRNQLGFTGVSISDALDMKAIADRFTPLDAVKHLFAAGVDMALMPLSIQRRSDIGQLDDLLTALERAFINKELSESDLDEAVLRIIKTKLKRQLVASNVVGKMQDTASLQHVAEDITRKSITLIHNNGLLPLLSGNEDDMGHVAILTPDISQALAMEKQLSTAYGIDHIQTHSYTGAAWQDIKSIVDQSDTVLIGTANNAPGLIQNDILPDDYVERYGLSIPDHQWARMVLKYANVTGKKTIVISMRMPYDAIHYRDLADAILSTCNYSGLKGGHCQSDSLARAIDVCMGAEPKGKLPVAIRSQLPDGETVIEYDMGFGLSYAEALPAVYQ